MLLFSVSINKTHSPFHLSWKPSSVSSSRRGQTITLVSQRSLRATCWVMCRHNVHTYTAASVVAAGLVKMSPVPRLKDSRGSSFGLLGLLGHSFVIMTSDLCRPVCWEECRRCLPLVRLMVSRWLLFFQSGMFFRAALLLSSHHKRELRPEYVGKSQHVVEAIDRNARYKCSDIRLFTGNSAHRKRPSLQHHATVMLAYSVGAT